MTTQVRLHYHYIYSFRWGNIKREIIHVNDCNLSEQQKLQNDQATPQYWKSHPGSTFVAFVSTNCCILVKTLQSGDIKIASHAKSSDYNFLPFHNIQEIGLGSYTCIFPRDKLMKIFDTRYISFVTVKDSLLTLKQSINTMVSCDYLQLHKCINDYEQHLLTQTKKLEKEPQFNAWAFQEVRGKLIGDAFAVQPEFDNKSVIPAVNEYSTSTTDCVVFHPNSVTTTLNLLNLHIEENESDVDIDESEVPTHAPSLVNVCASAFEVKSHKVVNAAIAECYSNMIGTGSRLATEALQGGRLVENINVYGLVFSMSNPALATLLFTSVNLTTGETQCKRLTQDIDLPLAFNLILTKLKSS